jgi:hypothetical protein
MDRRGSPLAWPVLLGGLLGMALGLWFDARAGGMATLAALCLGSPRAPAGMLALHWELLPGMHLGMIAGALAAVLALRQHGQPVWTMIARSLSCLAWMVLGMAAGPLALSAVAGSTAGPAAMLASMLAGMLWGMAAGTAVERWVSAWTRLPTLGTRG